MSRKRMRGYGQYDNDLYPKKPIVPVADLKDGTQASKVYDINTDSEKQDIGRMKYQFQGFRGNPPEAYDYEY